MDNKKIITNELIESILSKTARDMPESPGSLGYSVKQIREFFWKANEDILKLLSISEDRFIKLYNDKYFPDKTLTIDGAPADARSVGEKLEKKSDKKWVEEKLKEKVDASETNLLSQKEGAYSLVQKQGEGGVAGSSGLKKQSIAPGKNAVSFGVDCESVGDCTLSANYGAKALEKGCTSFGNSTAGRTVQEWIAYYWDVENWQPQILKEKDKQGNVEEVIGDLPSDWENQGIIYNEKDGKYYYVLNSSGNRYLPNGYFNPAFAEGQATKSKGLATHTQGYGTIADADFADADGQATGSHAHHGHAGGFGSENYSPYGFVHGASLNSSPKINGQAVFGTWNEENPDAQFQIGNGRDSKTRSNAFEVLKDGRAKVQSAPKDENDVVRLKELLSSISNINKLTYKVVAVLPTTGEDNIIYLVPNTNSTDKNVKDEYMWLNGTWELIGSTAVDLSEYTKDVQIDGTSIVENGVANIPYGTTTVFGLVKGSSDNGIQADGGSLKIAFATNDEIKAKTSKRKPIVPSNLDYAVKTGLTTNSLTLTAEQKANACNWLGLSTDPIYKFTNIDGEGEVASGVALFCTQGNDPSGVVIRRSLDANGNRELYIDCSTNFIVSAILYGWTDFNEIYPQAIPIWGDVPHLDYYDDGSFEEYLIPGITGFCYYNNVEKAWKTITVSEIYPNFLSDDAWGNPDDQFDGIGFYKE